MLNPVADFRNLIGCIDGNVEEGAGMYLYMHVLGIRGMRSKYTYSTLYYYKYMHAEDTTGGLQ